MFFNIVGKKKIGICINRTFPLEVLTLASYYSSVLKATAEGLCMYSSLFSAQHHIVCVHCVCRCKCPLCVYTAEVLCFVTHLDKYIPKCLTFQNRADTLVLKISFGYGKTLLERLGVLLKKLSFLPNFVFQLYSLLRLLSHSSLWNVGTT